MMCQVQSTHPKQGWHCVLDIFVDYGLSNKKSSLADMKLGFGAADDE